MKTTTLRAHLATHGGTISVREHPELRTAIAWLRRTGEITRVLPGTYAVTERWPDPALAATAARLWNVNSVVTGQLAASLHSGSTWKGEAELVVTTGRRLPRPFTAHRMALDPELVQEKGPIRVTTPAATAVWLAATDGGETIDEFLRRGLCTLSQIERAAELLRGRKGSATRRVVVDASRDEPWSPAERLAHSQLRRSRIHGWRTNVWFALDGFRFPVDVLFRREKLVIEVDGFSFHSDRETFERDRAKMNALVAAGWTVLRVTWAQLQDPNYLPGLVARVLRRKPCFR